MANGGDWGGVKVDQAFDEFLLDIVGMETMDRFRNEPFTSCNMQYSQISNITM
jgi:hypothetical protein